MAAVLYLPTLPPEWIQSLFYGNGGGEVGCYLLPIRCWSIRRRSSLLTCPYSDPSICLLHGSSQQSLCCLCFIFRHYRGGFTLGKQGGVQGFTVVHNQQCKAWHKLVCNQTHLLHTIVLCEYLGIQLSKNFSVRYSGFFEDVLSFSVFSLRVWSNYMTKISWNKLILLNTVLNLLAVVVIFVVKTILLLLCHWQVVAATAHNFRVSLKDLNIWANEKFSVNVTNESALRFSTQFTVWRAVSMKNKMEMQNGNDGRLLTQASLWALVQGSEGENVSRWNTA